MVHMVRELSQLGGDKVVLVAFEAAFEVVLWLLLLV